MKRNKLLLTILLLTGAWQATAQRHANLSLAVISPSDGTTIDNGDSKPLQLQLTNNGPDTFLTTDTLYIFGSLLNIPEDTAIKGRPNNPIPPGVTATLQFPGALATITNTRTETTDTTMHLCISIFTGNLMTAPVMTDITDTSSANNTVCVDLTFKGATTGISGRGGGWQNELKLYPNPARHNITFNLVVKAGETVRAVIQDMSGRNITSFDYGRMNAGEQKLTMDVSGLKPGMYLVTLYKGTDRQTGKMIIR